MDNGLTSFGASREGAASRKVNGTRPPRPLVLVVVEEPHNAGKSFN